MDPVLLIAIPAGSCLALWVYLHSGMLCPVEDIGIGVFGVE